MSGRDEIPAARMPDNWPDEWAQVHALVVGALATIGIAALAIVLFIGAGYWWGKWEIKVIKAKQEQVTTCGSCRLEKKK